MSWHKSFFTFQISADNKINFRQFGEFHVDDIKLMIIQISKCAHHNIFLVTVENTNCFHHRLVMLLCIIIFEVFLPLAQTHLVFLFCVQRHAPLLLSRACECIDRYAHCTTHVLLLLLLQPILRLKFSTWEVEEKRSHYRIPVKIPWYIERKNWETIVLKGQVAVYVNVVRLVFGGIKTKHIIY